MKLLMRLVLMAVALTEAAVIPGQAYAAWNCTATCQVTHKYYYIDPRTHLTKKFYTTTQHDIEFCSDSTTTPTDSDARSAALHQFSWPGEATITILGVTVGTYIVDIYCGRPACTPREDPCPADR